MKIFLKENIGFFSTMGVLSLLFVAMSFYSCGLEDDIKKAKDDLNNAHATTAGDVTKQSKFNDVAVNLRVARQDSKSLAESRRKMLENLDFLQKPNPKFADDPRENYKSKLSKTTRSSEVHNELLAFFDSYRKRLPDNGVSINSLQVAGDGGAGLPETDLQSQECFGFSDYRSAWPKFKDDEAGENEKTHRKIYKQMIIVSRLLDILIEVKIDDETQPLVLLGVKREKMEGEEDGLNSREILDPKNLAFLLVEKPGKIETYAFELKLEGRTHSLRKFISKLKPPFVVSDIKISRASAKPNNFALDATPAPFDLVPTEETDEPVEIPIISNVNSKFIITIEHITKTLANQEDEAYQEAYREAFLKKHYFRKDPDNEKKVRKPSSRVSRLLRENVFNTLIFKDGTSDDEMRSESEEMSPEKFENLINKVYTQEID